MNINMQHRHGRTWWFWAVNDNRLEWRRRIQFLLFVHNLIQTLSACMLLPLNTNMYSTLQTAFAMTLSILHICEPAPLSFIRRSESHAIYRLSFCCITLNGQRSRHISQPRNLSCDFYTKIVISFSSTHIISNKYHFIHHHIFLFYFQVSWTFLLVERYQIHIGGNITQFRERIMYVKSYVIFREIFRWLSVCNTTTIIHILHIELTNSPPRYNQRDLAIFTPSSHLGTVAHPLAVFISRAHKFNVVRMIVI